MQEGKVDGGAKRENVLEEHVAKEDSTGRDEKDKGKSIGQYGCFAGGHRPVILVSSSRWTKHNGCSQLLYRLCSILMFDNITVGPVQKYVQCYPSKSVRRNAS